MDNPLSEKVQAFMRRLFIERTQFAPVIVIRYVYSVISYFDVLCNSAVYKICLKSISSQNSLKKSDMM